MEVRVFRLLAYDWESVMQVSSDLTCFGSVLLM